jgi:paraquat-inducible protein A
MVMAHIFPFITMSTGSISTRLTLAECAEVLVRDGSPLVALGVVFFTMVSPLILVGGMFYVAAPLRHGLAFPGAVAATRWLQRVEPWSMLEVFLLGLIVSLLKLGSLAEMEFGLGLWALTALVFCTAAALGGIDRLELWDRLEIALQKQNAPNTPEVSAP